MRTTPGIRPHRAGAGAKALRQQSVTVPSLRCGGSSTRRASCSTRILAVRLCPPWRLTAIAQAPVGYSNLEFDLEAGERGSRYVHCASLLRELTGAEDALVVNNCAAALVLVLNTVAPTAARSIVSRGELVEIGGSFRSPDIMAKQRRALREVGTTNRTHLDDYRRAIAPETGAIVKVHRSNFAVDGLRWPSVERLVPLARARTPAAPRPRQRTARLRSTSMGCAVSRRRATPCARRATIVTMSGDKLLGGPQAGIILGPRGCRQCVRTIRSRVRTALTSSRCRRSRRRSRCIASRSARCARFPRSRMLSCPS